MSKTRMINTRFWSDNFVTENLNPLDRYLFLYFLTNEKTNICGVYELPLRTIASETGLDKEMLVKMMKRLEGKIDYFDGWVIVRNFLRYQNTDSPMIKKGIEKAMGEIPLKIRTFLDKSIPHTYPIDTLSIQPEESESKFESELELESTADTPSQTASLFFEGNGSYQELLEQFSKEKDRQFVEKEFKKFVLYWTEPNKSGTKVRWQQQNTFEVKRRLLTWLNRAGEYRKNYQKPKPNVIFS